MRTLLNGMVHRHPEALAHSLRPISDLLEIEDIAYLVNLVSKTTERRVSAEMREARPPPGTWADWRRLTLLLIKRALGFEDL